MPGFRCCCCRSPPPPEHASPSRRAFSTPDDQDANGALVARAYAANTWGSVVGSLVAGFGIAAYFDFEPSLRVVAVGYVLIAIVGAFTLRGVSRIALPLGVAAVVLGVAGGARALLRPSFVEHVEANTPLTIVRHEASIQGVTTIIELRERTPPVRILAVNHHGMTVKATDTKMMAHVPMFLHDKPDDTLVICFGMGTTFRSAMSHGGNVTVVEIVPTVADSFEYFYADAAQVRADPRGKIVVGDGRHFLMASGKHFDVITLDPPPPIDGEGVNSLYSTDFAALAREHLKPGGLAAHWMPLPGSGSGVDDDEGMAMVMASFASAFPYTRALMGVNGGGIHMIGSMSPIVVDDAVMRARLQQRPAAVKDMNEFDVIDPAFLLSGEPYVAPSNVLLTTDDQPLLEFYLLRSFVRRNGKVLTSHLWFP